MMNAEDEGSSRRQRAASAAHDVPWLTPYDLPVTWKWPRLFGLEAPVEVELGTGKGGFLLQAAPARPAHNFLGIDYAGKYLAIAQRRLAAAGARNVILFYGRHESILDLMPPASVAVFHVYFPDPWHKDRHATRRCLQPETLQWIHRALRAGGELRLRTDVASYFDEMRTTLGEFAAGFEPRSPLVYTSLPAPDWMPTNYERKFLDEGLTCHAVTAIKRG